MSSGKQNVYIAICWTIPLASLLMCNNITYTVYGHIQEGAMFKINQYLNMMSFTLIEGWCFVSHRFRLQQLDRADAPSAVCPQGGARSHRHGYSQSPLLPIGGQRRGHGRRLRQQNCADVRRRRQRGHLLLRPDDCRHGGTPRCYLKRLSQRWILTSWLDTPLPIPFIIYIPIVWLN